MENIFFTETLQKKLVRFCSFGIIKFEKTKMKTGTPAGKRGVGRKVDRSHKSGKLQTASATRTATNDREASGGSLLKIKIFNESSHFLMILFEFI